MLAAVSGFFLAANSTIDECMDLVSASDKSSADNAVHDLSTDKTISGPVSLDAVPKII